MAAVMAIAITTNMAIAAIVVMFAVPSWVGDSFCCPVVLGVGCVFVAVGVFCWLGVWVSVGLFAVSVGGVWLFPGEGD